MGVRPAETAPNQLHPNAERPSEILHSRSAGPVERLADKSAEHAAGGDEMVARKPQLRRIVPAVFGIERGPGPGILPFGFMPENNFWPILAAPLGSFFQARKPQTAPPPHAEKQIFADPSSRVHVPVTSPAIATDAVTIARATSKTRIIVLTLGDHFWLGGGPLDHKQAPVNARARGSLARAACTRP